MRETFPKVGEVGGTGNQGGVGEWNETGRSGGDECDQCDACLYCNDVCSWPSCTKCMDKRRIVALLTSRRDEYTLCQINRHSSVHSCWLVAHGRVYDATGFISHHPAGPRPILNRAGQDCTVDYDFHSRYSQRHYWRPLMVGKMVRCPGEEDGGGSPGGRSSLSGLCVIQ